MSEVKKLVEALLLVSHEPISRKRLLNLLEDHWVKAGVGLTEGASFDPQYLDLALQDLVDACEGRYVMLIETAQGWRYQTKTEALSLISQLDPEKAPKYSRATLETLAIIIYKQPVTRADIEDIRGVTVSTQIVRQLEERGWIEVVGQREVPGRPSLYGTTTKFLNDFGLRSLSDLPMTNSFGDFDQETDPRQVDLFDENQEKIRPETETFDQRGLPPVALQSDTNMTTNIVQALIEIDAQDHLNQTEQ